MPAQIVTIRVQVVRRLSRLNWLTSPAPGYAVQIPWRKPPAPPSDEIEQARSMPGWRPGMLAAAAPPVVEHLPWFKRQPTEDLIPAVANPGRAPWLTSPAPSYKEQIPWRHPLVTVDEPVAIVPVPASPWLTSPAPAYKEEIPWRHPLVTVDEPVVIVPVLAAPWITSPAPAYKDQIPWRHRIITVDEPVVITPVLAAPWVTSPAPAYKEYLPWRKRLVSVDEPPLEAVRPPVSVASLTFAYDRLPWLKRRPEIEPPVLEMGVVAPEWLFSPFPAYKDQIPWRHLLVTVDEPLVIWPVKAFPWLTSPAPAYKEQLPWRHLLVTVDEPVAIWPMKPLPWLVSPAPAYREYLPWLRRPLFSLEELVALERARGWQPGMTSAVVAAAEYLPWRRARLVEELPSILPGVPPGLSWLTSPAPAYKEYLPWLRRAVSAEEALVSERVRGWQPSMTTVVQAVDYLPWLKRALLEEVPLVQFFRVASPWITSPAPAYAEQLAWRRHPPVPFNEEPGILWRLDEDLLARSLELAGRKPWLYSFMTPAPYIDHLLWTRHLTPPPDEIAVALPMLVKSYLFPELLRPKPFILLVPVDPTAPQRTRLHEQIVAAILNSFLRRGDIVQTDAQEWNFGFLQGIGGMWNNPQPLTLTEALSRIVEALNNLGKEP